MFGTLHCKSHTKEVEFVERPHGSLDPEKISACDRCRAKKVRCNTNYGDCNRCKHLGETCTFSCSKHKGYKGRRKASANIGQQERSLDFLIRSSAPSSFGDIEHDESVCPEKRPFASPLTADADVDNNEQERQLLAEPLTDELVDSPPDFLAEFDQEISNQDGDSIFDFSFSPLPFSTTLPSTYPEPNQPASVETSDSLLKPPQGSGDGIPRYLPPTRQSQVWRAYPYQIPPGHSCQCLAAVIFAIEECEASCNSSNRSDLNSMVAYMKEAIKCCHTMLMCGDCMAKRENCVLLVFMAEKLVGSCGRIVALYRANNGDSRASSVPSSLLGCSPLNSLSHRVNIGDRDLPTAASSSSSKTDSTHPSSITSMCTGGPSDRQEFFLGDYQISSTLEWEHVGRVLIFLQLRELMELLADMKETGGKVLGETQITGLVQAEIKAGKLKENIHTI